MIEPTAERERSRVPRAAGVGMIRYAVLGWTPKPRQIGVCGAVVDVLHGNLIH